MEQGTGSSHEMAPDPKKDLENFYFNVFGWEVIKWTDEQGWLIKPNKDGDYVPLHKELSLTKVEKGVHTERLHIIIVDDISEALSKLKVLGGERNITGKDNEDITEYVETTNSIVSFGSDYAGNWFSLIQHNDSEFTWHK